MNYEKLGSDASHYLPVADTLKLVQATSFFNQAYGQTFNSFLTIHYGGLSIRQPEAASTFLTDMNNWINRYIKGRARKYRWDAHLWEHAYIYVHEHASDRGLHTHQLMWVPQTLKFEFDERLYNWVANWARRRCYRVPASAVLNKVRWHSKEHHRVKLQWYIIKYMLKSAADHPLSLPDGGSTSVHALLELRRLRPSWPVESVQRCGTSENIATKAQKEAALDFIPDPAAHVFSGWELDAFRQRVAAEARQEPYEFLRSLDL